MQYLLTVTPGPVNASPREGVPTYIDANGRMISDCSAAVSFTTTNGQLFTNGHVISTTGLVPYSPLVASPFVAAISTTFSVMNGSTLSWNNTAFTGGSALFCIMDNTVQAVYNGQLPSGCAQVTVGQVPVSSCPNFKPSSSGQPGAGGSGTGTASPSPTASVPGSIKGANATGFALGCLKSSVDSPAVSGGPYKQVTTLEQCTDFCASYAYFGVQSGKFPDAEVEDQYSHA
jgi:hypothetical protein